MERRGYHTECETSRWEIVQPGGGVVLEARIMCEIIIRPDEKP